MIDREAQKLSFIIKAEKKKYITTGVVAIVIAAIVTYIGYFYTGWFGIPGTEYLYFFERGMMPENTWTISDKGYSYAAEGAKMAKGLTEIDGRLYYFDDHGIMQTGWLELNGRKMFFGKDGKAVQNAFRNIEGSDYFFDQEGGLCFGWIEHEGEKYYSDSEGRRQYGFQTIEGKNYYFAEDGTLQTGWKDIDGKRYLFSETGEKLTGDRKEDGKLYYLDENGVMQTGWLETKDGMRYHKPSGEAAVGWTEVEYMLYYFDEDGIMQTGWIEIGEDSYYTEEDGTVYPGWHDTEEDGKFYVCRDGYVLDTDRGRGNFGRLVIKSCDIDVKVYTATTRDDYQKVVDAEDSALAVKERRDVETVISDRRSQGFDLSNVKEGTPAYFIDAKGKIHEYLCTSVEIGENTGADVLDDEENSVWKQNKGGLCTYTSAGTENKEEVIIAFWEEFIE